MYKYAATSCSLLLEPISKQPDSTYLEHQISPSPDHYSTSTMKVLLISSILAACAALTTATVTLGTLDGRKIAYINGVDLCADRADLGPADANQVCAVSTALPLM